MWLLWSVAALAADPTVALPPGEPSEPWHAPLRMAGLEVGESGEAARLRVEGSQWELCVSRAPEPTCVALEPPTTDRQREDVAWLVVSLQNELVFDAGGGAVVAATPRAVAKETSAVPPPAAEPAPPPAAEPPPPPAVEPALPPAAEPVPPPAAGPAPATPSELRPAPQPEVLAPETPQSSPAEASEAAAVTTPASPSSEAPPSVMAPVGAPAAEAGDASAEGVRTSDPEPAPSDALAVEPPSSDAGLKSSASEAKPRSSPPAAEQRLGLGARWQVAEGTSPHLTGEVRGPLGPLTGVVVAAVDSPIVLSEAPLRRTWTATAGVAAMWPLGVSEVGVGVGIEHQRWWQDSVLVEAALRPQVGVRGGVCPRDGMVCISGLTGWSLRRVTERSDGAAPSVATPLHLSLQVHLRRVSSGAESE